jgi:hypothetical protein
MADFNKPANNDVYVDIMDDIVSNQRANAVMFNGVVANNIPVNTVQYAGGVFGLWNGASFAPAAVSISGGGTGATTAAGARASLGISSNAEFDAKYMSQDANGSDIGDKSIFRSEIDVYSTAQVNAKTIINNTLTSTSTSQSLSAAQGKVLKDAQVRTPTTVWTGSDTQVTPAEILSSSGHVVQLGNYVITTSVVGVEWQFNVTISEISGFIIYGTNAGQSSQSSYVVNQYFQATNTSGSQNNIIKIKFYPL